MPKSALPEHLQDVENHFPDDDDFNHVPIFGKFYRWYQKKTKTWLCFSYRCTEWWARWRQYPVVLFAVRGDGRLRIEGDGVDSPVVDKVLWPNSLITPHVYLSRIQYWCRWHFAIQWPLMVSFHFYFKAKDVPIQGEPRPDSDGKLFFVYWGHFDADLVYWMFTSFYAGLGWK